MPILVDTSVWSRLFRRSQSGPDEIALALVELARQSTALMIGPVRQELLSGIREQERFKQLQMRLRAIRDHPIETAHFERAAEFSNLCRRKGFQGSPVDFLLCAVSDLDRVPIFTADADFDHFAKWLPIRRYRP